MTNLQLTLSLSVLAAASIVQSVVINHLRKVINRMSTGTNTLATLVPQLIQTVKDETDAISTLTAAQAAEHESLENLIELFKASNPTPDQQALLDQMAASIATAKDNNAGIGKSVSALNSDVADVTAALPGTGSTGPTLVKTTTTLTPSATAPTVGQDVTLQAVVAEDPTGAVPTGDVTFSDGGTALGTGTLDATGIASFVVTAITAGAHAFEASYPGDAANAGSTSVEVDVTV